MPEHPTPPTLADTGILLVGFGSTRPGARAVYVGIDAAVAARYPDLPRRWAYTSGFVRRRLTAQGIPVDSLASALAHLHDAGVKRVAVQSVHVIAGGEYETVRTAVAEAQLKTGTRDGFVAIALGGPLLESYPELVRTVEALLAVLPVAPVRQADDAVIIMGHGTSHPGDLAYAAADAAIRARDPRAMLATLEGYPTFDDALAQCQALAARRVWLLPMVVTAGTHVNDDMAGDGPEAWSSRLTAAGFTPLPITLGCGAHPAIIAIWLDHLAAALDSLHG